MLTLNIKVLLKSLGCENETAGVNEQSRVATRVADKGELRSATLRGDELLQSPRGVSELPNPVTSMG